MTAARRLPGLVMAGGLTVLATLNAQAHVPSVSSAELARCAAIAVAAPRLSCYDALAASILPARRIERSGASSFGLPPPQLPVAQEPSSIRARLTGVTADAYGDTLVQLDNGQTWKVDQPEAPLWRGESVNIKRAALGSFLMTTSDRRSYRVQRLR